MRLGESNFSQVDIPEMERRFLNNCLESSLFSLNFLEEVYGKRDSSEMFHCFNVIAVAFTLETLKNSYGENITIKDAIKAFKKENPNFGMLLEEEYADALLCLFGSMGWYGVKEYCKERRQDEDDTED